MKRSTRSHWMTVLGVTVFVATAALAIGNLTTSGNALQPRGAVHGKAIAGQNLSAKRSTIATELAELSDSRAANDEALKNFADAPGMPTCKRPTIPAPTYPPGNSYGVPFLAAITNGQVLSGYGEWTADNTVYKVTVGGKTKTYHLYPWEAKIFDITGWVTGLLQLPSLNAVIPPQDVVFCDQGGDQCLSASQPAGQCIQILTQYGPSPSSPTPPPAIGNSHPKGKACEGYSTKTFECIAYVVTLTPSGNSDLTVTGVEADGALNLQVQTAAVTTVSLVVPPPTPAFTCHDDPAKVTLTTVAPSSLPSTAPIVPTPPNPDDRYLQTPTAPLTGPLATASSEVGSNSFAIPAFFPNPSQKPCNAFVAESLNTYAGGFDQNFADQGEGRYYILGGNGPDAADPGWAQFSATTSVVTLGLNVGPPSNFSF
jgi:hypothetical protein